jgi:hypothetical protein
MLAWLGVRAWGCCAVSPRVGGFRFLGSLGWGEGCQPLGAGRACRVVMTWGSRVWQGVVAG